MGSFDGSFISSFEEARKIGYRSLIRKFDFLVTISAELTSFRVRNLSPGRVDLSLIIEEMSLSWVTTLDLYFSVF